MASTQILDRFLLFDRERQRLSAKPLFNCEFAWATPSGLILWMRQRKWTMQSVRILLIRAHLPSSSQQARQFFGSGTRHTRWTATGRCREYGNDLSSFIQTVEPYRLLISLLIRCFTFPGKTDRVLTVNRPEEGTPYHPDKVVSCLLASFVF